MIANCNIVGAISILLKIIHRLMSHKILRYVEAYVKMFLVVI